jgi:hypothetical protein
MADTPAFYEAVRRWLTDITGRDAQRVVAVNDWGSDYADGDTENGFTGDFTVVIIWYDAGSHKHRTEITPGNEMASLWRWLVCEIK